MGDREPTDQEAIDTRRWSLILKDLIAAVDLYSTGPLPPPGAVSGSAADAKRFAAVADQQLGEVLDLSLAEIEAFTARVLDVPGVPKDTVIPELTRLWQTFVVLHNNARITPADLGRHVPSEAGPRLG